MDNYLKEKEGLTRAQCAYYRQVEETCKHPTKNKVFSSTEGRRCLSLSDSNYGMPCIELSRFTRLKRPRGLLIQIFQNHVGLVCCHLAQQSGATA